MTIESPQHWLRVDALVDVVKVRIQLMYREDEEVIVNVKKCTAMSKSKGIGILIHCRIQYRYSVRYGKDWLWVALAHVTFNLFLNFDRLSNHALKRCIIVEIFFSIFVFMFTCFF